uniref:Neuromodulin n=1 Tax=Poecilia latipinna TaxID=48699 RepID=A0A3B3V2S0_9TELE
MIFRDCVCIFSWKKQTKKIPSINFSTPRLLPLNLDSWFQFQLLTCMSLASQVEKNEDADQKIEQDGTPNKPEDKAHKAATKIQASFRGHITRKKMKDGEEEKDGDSPAAEEAANGEETKKAEGEEAPAKQEETTGEEAKKEGEETNQAKTPGADKPANSPAGTATSPVAAAPAAASPTAATAPSEPQKEEPKAEEKPKEVEATAKSPTTATAEEKKEEKSEEKKEEARKADVPAAVSLTAEKEEPNQTNDKKDAAEESKAEENAHPDGAAETSEAKED